MFLDPLDKSLLTCSDSECQQLITKFVTDFSAETLKSATGTDLKQHVDAAAKPYYEKAQEMIVSLSKHLSKNDPDFSVTFSVWGGPPGTGKSTNLDAMAASMAIVAKAYKQKNMEPQSSIKPLVYSYTEKSSAVVVGTGGISNAPKGEYLEIFGNFQPLIKTIVQGGEFVGDIAITLMIFMTIILRLKQGARKIQLNLWPRTESQQVFYDQFIAKLKESGVQVYSELMNLRLLTTEEIALMRGSVDTFAETGKILGKQIKQKLQAPETAEIITLSKQESTVKAQYELTKHIVSDILDELKKEYVKQENDAAAIILRELERVISRLEYRFQLALDKGEEPRPDELPYSQLNRLVVFVSETSPAALKASQKQAIDFVSAYQPPANVIQDILTASISQIEKGSFKNEYPQLWNEIFAITGEVAEQIVKGEVLDYDGMATRLAAQIV